MSDDIGTDRLLLRLYPLDTPETDMPEDLRQDPAVLHYARAALEADPAYGPWSLRGIHLSASMEMVGHVRFHSRPDPEYLHPYARNAVELGYVVFPRHRRRGYAREAVVAAMRWARGVHGVESFVVTVSPDNLPSLQLIVGLGFRRIGEHVDPVDGVEGIYLLGAGEIR